MAIDKDKPAYPRPVGAGGGRYNIGSEGMTIREAFAMAAMQGLMANGQMWDVTEVQIAQYATRAADALIAELNKEQQ